MNAPAGAPRTLYDKIFDDHVVERQEDGTCLIYIDRHLVHEVTSPQAFEGLRMAGRQVRVLAGRRIVEGLALGLAGDGGLRVATEVGEQVFHGGEVSVRAR